MTDLINNTFNLGDEVYYNNRRGRVDGVFGNAFCWIRFDDAIETSDGFSDEKIPCDQLVITGRKWTPLV